MAKRHYIIPIFVPHEGCPHDCVFCNQNIITGQVQQIQQEQVIETIDSYLKTMDKSNSEIEVSFFGGTFTAINEKKQIELLSVAKQYKDAGKINHIRLSTRPDYIDDIILTRLKEFSVDIIELGVQSMDDEVLLKSGRGHTKENTIKASNLIKKYGFTLGLQIMIGLPGDDFSKDIATTMEVVKLKPDLCRIYPSLVIKDTPMEKMFSDKLYIPYTLEESIEIVKKVYMILIANNINVIRVGLQPTDTISENGDIISGPFHPAYRELVESSIINDLITEHCKKLTGNVKITVNEKLLSKLYGWKKKFFNDMKGQLSDINVTVNTDNELPLSEIKIEYSEICDKLSIFDYYVKKAKEGNFYIL